MLHETTISPAAQALTRIKLGEKNHPTPGSVTTQSLNFSSTSGIRTQTLPCIVIEWTNPNECGKLQMMTYLSLLGVFPRDLVYEGGHQLRDAASLHRGAVCRKFQLPALVLVKPVLGEALLSQPVRVESEPVCFTVI